MKKQNNPLKHIQVVVRPSPLALKILLTLLIVLSMGTLVTLRWVSQEIQAETRSVLAEVNKLDYANSELERLTKNVDNIPGIKEIAKRELGFVEPNTQLIDPN